MFYANPSQEAGLGQDNGRFNSRAILQPGGAADGLAQLAEALVRAPALRRQLDEKRREVDFRQGMESRAADRADRQMDLMDAFHREGLAEKKAESDRRGKADYQRAEDDAVRLDETGRHHRALEDALAKSAAAKANPPARSLPLHEAEVSPYVEEMIFNGKYDTHGHRVKRLKTDDEIQQEIDTRKRMRDALGPQAPGGGIPGQFSDATYRPGQTEQYTPDKVLDLIKQLQGQEQPATAAAPAVPAAADDDEASETVPDDEAKEAAGGDEAAPAPAAPAAGIPPHLQEAESDPRWRAHLDKKFPARKTDPAQAKAASDYVAQFVQ